MFFLSISISAAASYDNVSIRLPTSMIYAWPGVHVPSVARGATRSPTELAPNTERSFETRNSSDSSGCIFPTTPPRHRICPEKDNILMTTVLKEPVARGPGGTTGPGTRQKHLQSSSGRVQPQCALEGHHTATEGWYSVFVD